VFTQYYILGQLILDTTAVWMWGEYSETSIEVIMGQKFAEERLTTQYNYIQWTEREIEAQGISTDMQVYGRWDFLVDISSVKSYAYKRSYWLMRVQMSF